MTRLVVPKTYKLFIAGGFPRSESGRTYPVSDIDGAFLANAAMASRKDVREAVVAARRALPGWSGATAYNRGQVLYRVAELLDARRTQFADEIDRTTGVGLTRAQAQVDDVVDTWIWYAGWTDKLLQVAGNANPVSGPFFNLSVIEPTGVVAIVAPQSGGLPGLVGVVAPALVAGNTVVVVASEPHPLSAITLAEVLAVSDVPAGVVNILTGSPAELLPTLASHADINAVDLCGAASLEWVDAQMEAAQSLKRVLPPDPAAVPAKSLARILAFTETKTIWHTKSTR